MNNIIRVISGYSGEPDRYYDLTDMSWNEANELRVFLKGRGNYVQDIYIDNPIMIRVAIEIQKRDEAEKSTK